MDHIPTVRTEDALSKRAGNHALTPTLINGITYVPAVFWLSVVVDGVVAKQSRIKLSAHNGEGLLCGNPAIGDELVYLINASMGNYAWDSVRIIGADGGVLKTVANPQRLPDDYHHPPLNRRHLVYLEPTA